MNLLSQRFPESRTVPLFHFWKPLKWDCPSFHKQDSWQVWNNSMKEFVWSIRKGYDSILYTADISVHSLANHCYIGEVKKSVMCVTVQFVLPTDPACQITPMMHQNTLPIWGAFPVGIFDVDSESKFQSKYSYIFQHFYQNWRWNLKFNVDISTLFILHRKNIKKALKNWHRNFVDVKKLTWTLGYLLEVLQISKCQN